MKISYRLLDAAAKEAIQERLELRKTIFEKFKQGKLNGGILIVGDRPGPSAPKEPGYHHTPFYSTKHCSGWLNAALHVEGISETNLVWINSVDEKGQETDHRLVERLEPESIIALGGNAASWVMKHGLLNFIKVTHPQFHKRFKNSERYELLDLLATL